MPYSVQFTPEAIGLLRALRATDMAKVVDQCHRILSVNPTLESRARIKRLRHGVFPPYRLRIDEHRIFYDVEQGVRRVLVYGVVAKAEANEWLAAFQEEQSREDDDA
jgi:mRNA-degrading endonuclease RelE of RelBE toxin-antitoxin system